MRGKNTPQDKIDKIISLRKEGCSYSDLQKEFKIGKATLSVLLKDVKLDSRALSILETKRYKNKYSSIRDWDDARKWTKSAIGKIGNRDKLLIFINALLGRGNKK